jgi:hypothetical protein
MVPDFTDLRQRRETIGIYLKRRLILLSFMMISAIFSPTWKCSFMIGKRQGLD